MAATNKTAAAAVAGTYNETIYGMVIDSTDDNTKKSGLRIIPFVTYDADPTATSVSSNIASASMDIRWLDGNVRTFNVNATCAVGPCTTDELKKVFADLTGNATAKCKEVGGVLVTPAKATIDNTAVDPVVKSDEFYSSEV